MRYFLSIDYGGTNTKAVLFNEDGQQLAVSSFETLRIEDKPGYREVDLAATWQAISNTVKKVIEKSGINSQSISAVACIGHGKGLYLLDKKGRPFKRGILSTDNRAAALAQQFEKRVSEIWPLTQQHIVGVQNPILLRWLKEHEPELYQEIGSILSAKDFVRFKLTDKINQEYGDASGNHWINFKTGTYDEAILDFFGIAEMSSALPPLVDYAQVVGGVSRDAAHVTGLTEGTPVIGGLFDIDACAIGSGVLDNDVFSVISGTWNINTYSSKTAADQASGHMNSYFPNRDFLIEASSPTSAGNLDAILKMLMAEEIKNSQQEGGSIYDNLEVFLRETSASYTPVLFFPFLYGSNVGRDARASFLGLSSTTTKSHMVRAVYEGIVFAHKQHIDQLVKTRGRKPRKIRLSGGATNSKAWMQIFSDGLAIPIETVEGSELGALGGAIACLQAIDGLSLEEACHKMVKPKDYFEPVAAEHACYEEKYRVYQSLIEAMQPHWESLIALENLHELIKRG
ncbi:carbohydrate kinase [Streptococcus criceti]|uniref:Carbohydrate kinase, FGGY family n=2 Tax=Streptococcus criceti TaxID=1333 RepID=G5JSY0_STRCG|nr:FGGY-family carbohydrate kinase [Streptococcus criceti]EHI73490.1 carbohydrate kinase, FGGY family [Streptococcus criceti HS-6]SUN43499.1 carbohydrate kinase [Streptococcus criceti]BAO01170.1 carbohydrate kinase [Streptococcus criceti]BAO01175.1 carbohydrate kinase [Streptococcus criceti]BAO01180.1 carbohydrate kinase [Streptococcus criceti]